MNVNIDLSGNPATSPSVSSMDFLADPASRLISQIRALMKKPEVASVSGRSPLFHIAAQLEMPALPKVPAPASAITGKNFADVREEALKPQPVKRPGRLIFRAKPIKATPSTPNA
jgi:hypothetical protein